MTQPAIIYYGKTEDMILEVSAYDYEEGNHRYCVMPYGEPQFYTEPCDTLKDAKYLAREYAKAAGCKAVRV